MNSSAISVGRVPLHGGPHPEQSSPLQRDDLDMAPFDAMGGLGKMFQLFGERTEPLIAELNEALAA